MTSLSATNHRIPTQVGELTVDVLGDGPPAVFWHSLFVDSGTWAEVAREFAGDRRLILITGPGHGGSTDPGGPYRIGDCAVAAEEVLEALGITGPVDWVGKAWGGHVGIVLAATRPQRVRSLALFGTPTQALPRADRMKMKVLRLMLLLPTLPGPVRDGVLSALLSPRAASADVEQVRAYLAEADRVGLRNAIASISLRRPDLTGALRSVRAPLLVATGQDDEAYPPYMARDLGKHLRTPPARVAVVPAAARLAPLENPEACVRLLREFWGSAPGLL